MMSGSTSSAATGNGSSASVSNITVTRLKRELQMLSTDPPFGCTAWPNEENMLILHAEIEGPPNTPYSQGTFQLSLQLPPTYPLHPPLARFQTRIYHPNIDSQGRICSSILKLPPSGCWTPAMNLKTVLASLRVLMGEPNVDDPLEFEIAEEWKGCKAVFERKAREMTIKYAVGSSSSSAPSGTSAMPLSTVDAATASAVNSSSTSSGSGHAGSSIPAISSTNQAEKVSDDSTTNKGTSATVSSSTCPTTATETSTDVPQPTSPEPSENTTSAGAPTTNVTIEKENLLPPPPLVATGSIGMPKKKGFKLGSKRPTPAPAGEGADLAKKLKE
ncbi:Ubiquitin-conjugating enzyme E2 T [Chytridiales sp. JEL 0842]|nr:Ubiquitin-conjugating enzyme E2 T [Chytridiales sp. JEL 0842]